MPQQVLSSALEKIINQALTLNLNANHDLASLNEKTLTVTLAELGFPLCFNIMNNIVYVNGNNANSDCTINTSLKSLWQLKQSQQLTELIKQDKLNLQGDIKIAQLFASLFENIDIDWQSEIAKHIGDIPTYQLSQLFNVVKKKASFAAKQIPSDASEWLIHEKRLVVTNAELSQFHHTVNGITEEITSVNNRINALSKKINAL